MKTKTKPRPAKPASPSSRARLLSDLAGAIVKASFALAHFMERIHGEGETSSGRRALLLNLKEMGEATVPQLAQMRPVSRQYIQKLMDGLEEGGFVAPRANPRHARSALFALTASGKREIARMTEREAPFIARVARALDAAQSEETIAFLESLRSEIDGAVAKARPRNRRNPR